VMTSVIFVIIVTVMSAVMSAVMIIVITLVVFLVVGRVVVGVVPGVCVVFVIFLIIVVFQRDVQFGTLVQRSLEDELAVCALIIPVIELTPQDQPLFLMFIVVWDQDKSAVGKVVPTVHLDVLRDLMSVFIVY